MDCCKPSKKFEVNEAKDVPTWCSCRFMMAYVGFFGFLFLYALRFDLSVAIVCMVRSPVVNETEGTSMVSFLMNSTDTPVSNEPVCEVEAKDTGNGTAKQMGDFEWTRPQVGYALGSFFWGYILTQVPGGWIAGYFGGKRVFGIGMLITAIATMILPSVAKTTYGFQLTLFMRIIMGMGTGVAFPSMHNLWSKWAPPLERTKLIAFTYAGTMIGNITAFFLSGILCEYAGWPSIFYLFGGGTFVWLVFWWFLVFDSPNEHPRISALEKDFVTKAIGKSVQKKTLKIPWKKILTSLPIWSIVVAHVCNNWGNYTLMTCLPSYMKDVLKFDMKSNGLFSALPYMGMFVTAIGGSALVDYIRTKGASTTIVRKVVQGIAFGFPCVFLIGLGFLDCTQKYLAVGLVVIAVTFNAMCRSGYIVNHVDIAPRYAGILFGFTNTFATVPGMVAPLAVGQITVNKTREEWQIVFYICAGFYGVGAIFYSLFGTGVEQSWATSDEDKKADLEGADDNEADDGQVTVPLNAVGSADKTANGETDTKV
ncbi:sialin-like isoform X2 [Lineus longissimus]|uniref:sialin-like isoform X2 n=1 Tax=Lineus longissimus TaxID=88925 RepID=UPI002B4C712E